MRKTFSSFLQRRNYICNGLSKMGAPSSMTMAAVLATSALGQVDETVEVQVVFRWYHATRWTRTRYK